MADEPTTAAAPAGTTADPPAATTTTAPPAASSGAATAPWHASLPDGLKTEKTLHAFKDVGALAQSYMELKRQQSGSVKMPGKDAKPEEIAAFNEARGVPKAPSDYKLTPPSGVPIDEKRFASAAATFHRLGFTNDQAQGLAEWAHAEDQARAAATNEGYLADLDKLADAWGKQTFDKRVQLASRVIDRFASPEVKKFLDDTKLTNHPGLFQIFAQIGEQFAEDGIIDGRVDGMPTQEQAKDQIAALNKELQGMSEGPRRQELMQKREQLFKTAYGTAEVDTGVGRR